MANLFELPRYIAVEGPIRVGKSTLARILAERLNGQRVMEPEVNPFLHSFYEGERGAAPVVGERGEARLVELGRPEPGGAKGEVLSG